MIAIGPATPVLSGSSFTSFDGDRFPCRSWVPNEKPALTVVAFHGIAGAATDWSDLGERLLAELPGAALYAPDLRGQGHDPVRSRRGDILHRSEWFRDALTLTALVRARHPGTRIVWAGESMGSLIATHAAATAPAPPCEALLLASPIARLHDGVPPWKRRALRWGAALLPKLRLSLETLSGQRDVRVVRDTVHQDQAQTNPYHVPAFSLRLLCTLGEMIESMTLLAPRLRMPVFILHGGHDLFSRTEDVVDFAGCFPAPGHVRRTFYPDSYHLLFYDHESERVLTDVVRWLRELATSCDGPAAPPGLG